MISQNGLKVIGIFKTQSKVSWTGSASESLKLPRAAEVVARRREVAAHQTFCLGCDVSCFRKLIHTPYRPECRVRPSNPRADCLPDLRERRWYEARERERADEASSRQLPPLELPPNRHWPLHESVQGSQHLPQGDRGEPQQDRHARLELPKGEQQLTGQGHPPSALN